VGKLMGRALVLVVGAGMLAAVVLGLRARSSDGRPGDDAPAQGNGGSVVTVSSRPAAWIVLEAEDAEELEPPVRLAEGVEGASGGRCCYLGPEKVNERPETAQYTKGYAQAAHPGYARIRFGAPTTAVYVVWVRVRWSDDCGDSLDVVLDGTYLGTIQGNADKENPRWIWLRVGGPRDPVTRRLGQGTEHTVTLCNREDDLYFDQVLLVDADSPVEPVGIVAP